MRALPKNMSNTANTETDLAAARNYAALIHNEICAEIDAGTHGYASHVTGSEKAADRARHAQLAEDIRAGTMDHNFTVWQAMNYFLTGHCVALLP